MLEATMNQPTAFAAVTFVVGALSYALRRAPGARALWARVPDRWRWLVPFALAALAAYAEALQSGRSYREAAALAFAAWLAAMGGHKGLSDMPFLPYGEKPAVIAASDKPPEPLA